MNVTIHARQFHLLSSVMQVCRFRKPGRILPRTSVLTNAWFPRDRSLCLERDDISHIVPDRSCTPPGSWRPGLCESPLSCPAPLSSAAPLLPADLTFKLFLSLLQHESAARMRRMPCGILHFLHMRTSMHAQVVHVSP